MLPIINAVYCSTYMPCTLSLMLNMSYDTAGMTIKVTSVPTIGYCASCVQTLRVVSFMWRMYTCTCVCVHMFLLNRVTVVLSIIYDYYREL